MARHSLWGAGARIQFRPGPWTYRFPAATQQIYNVCLLLVNTETMCPSSPMQLHVNGDTYRLNVAATRSLLDVLREELGLCGTKYGCGEGECGACTVLLDGEPVRSCVTTLADAAGQKIRTIEGLADAHGLHPVQQAFVDKLGLQCGYCVPGQIMRTVALLNRHSEPTTEQITEALDGNICRCCNYINIRLSIEEAARRLRSGSEKDA